jgi:hypothetical protein
MLDRFDDWSALLAEGASMDQLKGATVGIEAAEYLDRLAKLSVPDINRAIEEALLPALGGLPFGLKFVIQQTLLAWKEHEITPFFVFSGLDVGKRDPKFVSAEAGVQTNKQAWVYYDGNHGELAVKTFAESSLVTAEDLYRYLQEILREQDVEFQVAPYSAHAQLAYLQRSSAIDAIYGASEVLLYDVSEVITSWDFKASEFTWVRKEKVLKHFSVSSDVFVDACLLAGCTLLPPLPQLDNQQLQQQHMRMKKAVDMIVNLGQGSGYNVCAHYQDDPVFHRSGYLDRYKRARLAVKHHPVLLSDGRVDPLESKRVPNDVIEIIGQRLSEELYFYVSKGILGPRILNWRTSGEILEPPPLDGGESSEYRGLVRDQLTEVRTSAIALLSYSLHRVYQHKGLNLRCWFDKDSPKVINMKDIENPVPHTSKWNVHEDVFNPFIERFDQPVGFRT